MLGVSGETRRRLPGKLAMGPLRTVPHGEYESRYERLRDLLQAARVDSLVVTAEANLRYFTGFAPHMYVSPTRPWFAVLPVSSAPFAIVPEMGVGDMRRESWLARIDGWPSPRPADEGVSLLADALLALPRRFGRVGFELGPETRLGMPVADFLSLRQRIGGSLEAVDTSAVIQRLRGIKSELELSFVREAIDAAQFAFDSLGNRARPALTEKEIYRFFQSDALLGGAERTPYVAIGSGPDGYDSIVRGPTGRRLAEGDILGVDTGVTIEGYWADFNRNMAISRSCDEAKVAYNQLWRAQEAGKKMLRPGIRASEIWRVMAALLPSADSSVGRMGHGIGLDYTEPPSIHSDDHTPIEAGMVITLEPSFGYAVRRDGRFDERFMALEEDFFVTGDGPVLLTKRAPAELPVI
jgi:Xaa-Pro dipeptidase